VSNHDGSTTQGDYDFTLEGGAGIYSLEWPQLLIKADVARLKENSDHELRGEIWIESRRPNSTGHVKQGRIILTSPSNRKQFAKALEDRDSEVDWDQIVDQLAIAVLEDWRAGIPEVAITGSLVPTQANRWLIQPLVQVGHPTLIYGKGSTGKSWLAQYLSVLVHEGMSVSGLMVEQSRVLYLDWETDINEIEFRIAMIRKGLGLSAESKDGIWYKAMTQGLAGDIATVRSIVQKHSIHFVVLDSLGAACMGEPESAEVVLRMFAALRSLSVTSLCVDHVSKEGSLFGSVYKFNAARQIFEAKKAQGEGEDRLEFAMFHRKANNSKLVKPLGWVLEFDNDQGIITMTRKDVRDTNLSGEMRIVDQISSILRDGPHAVKDISDILEKTPGHISKELATHKHLFLKLPNGLYANLSNMDPDSGPEPGARAWEA
jgi:hypothetical protein